MDSWGEDWNGEESLLRTGFYDGRVSIVCGMVHMVRQSRWGGHEGRGGPVAFHEPLWAKLGTSLANYVASRLARFQIMGGVRCLKSLLGKTWALCPLRCEAVAPKFRNSVRPCVQMETKEAARGRLRRRAHTCWDAMLTSVGLFFLG